MSIKCRQRQNAALSRQSVSQGLGGALFLRQAHDYVTQAIAEFQRLELHHLELHHKEREAQDIFMQLG